MPQVLNKRRATKTQLQDSVYIGRPSKWGNPFVIGTHGDRATVIAKYEQYLKNNKALLSTIEELRGKNLVCWCSPLPCHGDVLLKLANKEPPDAPSSQTTNR